MSQTEEAKQGATIIAGTNEELTLDTVNQFLQDNAGAKIPEPEAIAVIAALQHFCEHANLTYLHEGEPVDCKIVLETTAT